MAIKHIVWKPNHKHNGGEAEMICHHKITLEPVEFSDHVTLNDARSKTAECPGCFGPHAKTEYTEAELVLTPDTFDYLVGDVENIIGHTVSFEQVHNLAQVFVQLHLRIADTD